MIITIRFEGDGLCSSIVVWDLSCFCVCIINLYDNILVSEHENLYELIMLTTLAWGSLSAVASTQG